jgi:hypothetical protein
MFFAKSVEPEFSGVAMPEPESQKEAMPRPLMLALGREGIPPWRLSVEALKVVHKNSTKFAAICCDFVRHCAKQATALLRDYNRADQVLERFP